jgi:hypothetical protein
MLARPGVDSRPGAIVALCRQLFRKTHMRTGSHAPVDGPRYIFG